MRRISRAAPALSPQSPLLCPTADAPPLCPPPLSLSLSQAGLAGFEALHQHLLGGLAAAAAAQGAGAGSQFLLPAEVCPPSPPPAPATTRSMTRSMPSSTSVGKLRLLSQ